VNLVVSPRYCESGAGPSLRFENRGCDPGRPRTCEGNCNARKGLRQKHMDTKKGKGTYDCMPGRGQARRVICRYAMRE